MAQGFWGLASAIAAAAQGHGSGTRTVPRSIAPARDGAPASYSEEDRSFDIAESLNALDALALHRDSADIRRQVEHASEERETEVRTQFKKLFARPENA